MPHANGEFLHVYVWHITHVCSSRFNSFKPFNRFASFQSFNGGTSISVTLRNKVKR